MDMSNDNSFYTALERINWAAVIVIAMVSVMVIHTYTKYGNANLEPDVLAEIESVRSTDPNVLEANKTQVLFMEERGWYFIALGTLIVAIFIGRKFIRPKRLTQDYRKRVMNRLSSKVKSSLDFAARLRLKYGTLTDHDLKVAEMLVNGLSSKEIATQLNISPSSVNTARYRLRKRMALSQDTDLIAVLQKV